MRFLGMFGLVLVLGCGTTDPDPKPAIYQLEHVQGALVTTFSGDVPYAQVSGTDTNWIQDGRVMWDPHRVRYAVLVYGVLSQAGVRTSWQIADSGAFLVSSWQCNGCMPFRLVSDLHFDPEGEIRFIPDTGYSAATGDVYNLAGDGFWVYTFRRQ
jgi:hypothetical protein